MSETPLSFRHHGLAAGLREPGVASLAAVGGVPRRWRRAWGWLGVAAMGGAACLWWRYGGQYPARSGDIDPEISPEVDVAIKVPEVLEVVEVVAPPVRIEPAAPVVSVMLEAAKPVSKVPQRETWRPKVATVSSPPMAELSLVQVNGVDEALVSEIRTAVMRRHRVLRACCENVMRTEVVKGEVVARVAVRAGRVSAIDVGSTSQSARLRWCFRKELMSLAVGGGDFDARLEFFLLPRRSSGSR